MTCDRLVFVADRRQFGQLINDDLCDGAVIASGDLEVILEAEAGGHPTLDLWGYLSEEEARVNDELGWTLCREMGDAVAGQAVFEGCDLAGQVRYELFEPIRCALNTAVTTSRALAATEPKEVVYGAEMSRGFIWDPVEQPQDIFNAAVAWTVARDDGCSHRAVPLAPPHDAPSQGVKGVRPITRLPVGSRRPPAPVIKQVALSPSCDYVELDLYLAHLSKHKRDDWLIITEESCMGQDALPALDRASLDGLPYLLADLPVTVREMGREGLPRPAALRPGTEVVFEPPVAGILWQTFCELLVSSARSYAAADFLARALVPEVFVVGYDVWGTLRCFVDALHRQGVSTLAVHHSGLGHTTSCRRHTGARGASVVWGKWEEVELGRWRAAGTRFYQVGSLREDVRRLSRDDTTATLRSKPSARAKIVLLTAKVASLSIPVASVSNHRRTLRDIFDLCARQEQWDFVVKPHPRYDYHALYCAEVEKSSRGNLRVSDRPASVELKDADVAVLVNYPSTVGIEALLDDVPLLYLREAVFKWSPAVFEGRGVLSIDSVADLESELGKLLYDEEHRRVVLDQQRSFLAEALQATGSAAVQRFDEAAADVVANRTPGDAHEPSRAARWVLDMIVAVDYFRYGILDRRGFAARLKMLRREATNLCFEQVGLLDPAHLGAYFLGLVTGVHGDQSFPLPKPRVLWDIYRTMPVRLRPGLNQFRQALAKGFLQDGAHRYVARRVSAPWLWMHRFLAPGALRPRRRETEGVQP